MLLLCINVNGTTLFEVKYGKEVKTYTEKDLKTLSNDIKEYKDGVITINQSTNIDNYGNYNWVFNDNIVIYYNMNGYSLNFNNNSPFIVLGKNNKINVRGLTKDQNSNHNFKGYKEYNSNKLETINVDYPVFTNNISGAFIKGGKSNYINLNKICLGGNNISNYLINIDEGSDILFNYVDIINNKVNKNSIIKIDGEKINFKASNSNFNYNYGNKKNSSLINVNGKDINVDILDSSISNNEFNNRVIYFKGNNNSLGLFGTTVFYNSINGNGIIYINGDKNTIGNGKIDHNNVKDGVLYIDGKENNLIDVSFDSNSATNGGAIYINGSSNVITRGIFLDNHAKYGYDIYNNGEYNKLEDCAFNRDRKGAIYEESIILLDEDTTFKNTTNTPKIKNKKNIELIKYIYIFIAILIIILFVLFIKRNKKKSIIVKNKRK